MGDHNNGNGAGTGNSGSGSPAEPTVTVTSADGYTLTINADQLSSTATDVKGDQSNTAAMQKHLRSTMVPTAAFGTIPHGPTVAADLLTSYTAHVKAVSDMGLSVGALGGRIQQAATMAFESEPVTRQVATLNAPNGMLTPQQTNPTTPGS